MSQLDNCPVLPLPVRLRVAQVRVVRDMVPVVGPAEGRLGVPGIREKLVVIAPFFILGIIAVISAGDYWLHVVYAKDHLERDWTISRFVMHLGQWWPLSVGLLGFAMGCLFGHLYLGIAP